MAERDVAAELDAIADTYEQRAMQLRMAAQIVREAAPLSGVGGVTFEGVGTLTLGAPAAQPSAKPTGDDYRRVIREQPEMTWDPEMLAEAMRRAGFHVNHEAARTMLYRLAKAGFVVKHGRGSWRLPEDEFKPEQPEQVPDFAESYHYEEEPF